MWKKRGAAWAAKNRTLWALVLMVLCGSGVSLNACSENGNAMPAAPEHPNVGLQEPDSSLPVDTLRIGVINCSVGWLAENFVLRALNDSQSVYNALVTLYDQYRGNLPQQRMRVLAAYLAQYRLDVIALQEVQSMTIGDSLSEDFLRWIQDGLAEFDPEARWVAIRQKLNRTALNVPDSSGRRMHLDFFEGNVVLVRAGLRVLDTAQVVFRAGVNINLLGENKRTVRGYQRVVLQGSRGAVWEIMNTHLEVELLGVINVIQAQQLNAEAWESWQLNPGRAQILVGDLNARPGLGAVAALTGSASGLVDLWNSRETTEEEGWTCCAENFFAEQGGYDRRIDYVLGRNILRARVTRVLPWLAPLWGSDHAMLIAEIEHQVKN